MNQETRLGLFILLGAACFVLSVILLGDFQFRSTYKINVIFDNVTGLPSKAKIKIAGVALRRPTDVVEVLNMVRDKRVEVSGLVSKRYGYEQINDAFHDLEAGKNLMGITVWN